MLLGSAPVGSVPVGAGPSAIVTPLPLVGKATTIERSFVSSAFPSQASARSSIDVEAKVSSKAIAPLAGVVDLDLSAHISLGIPHSLTGLASLDVEAGALVKPKLVMKAKGLTDVRGEALGSFLPNLIGGRGIDLKVGAKGILSFTGQNHLVLPIFPVLAPLTWSVHKKPIMASRVTIGATGRENQLAGAVYPRWAFTLSYGGNSWLRERTQNIVPDPTMNSHVELEALSGLFLYVKGSFGEFYYEDPDDNSRNNQFVGIGDGVTTTFPLTVSWGFGPFTPSFTYPVGGIKLIDSVYFNGVAQPTTEFNLDFNNTSLVFVMPPPAGVTITTDFDFYFRCRFLDDHLEFSQWARNRWEAKEVRFESVKA